MRKKLPVAASTLKQLPTNSPVLPNRVSYSMHITIYTCENVRELFSPRIVGKHTEITSCKFKPSLIRRLLKHLELKNHGGNSSNKIIEKESKKVNSSIVFNHSFFYLKLKLNQGKQLPEELL